MWKRSAAWMIAVVVAACSLTALLAQEAGAPGDNAPVAEGQPVGGGGGAAAQDNDAPRRAAKEFAPWIRAIIQEKPNIANPLFPMRPHAQETVETPAVERIFRKFPKLDGLDLALIGGRSLGDQTGVLLFTITTETGPVAFKIYHYRFGNVRSVGKIEVTDDWSEIERLYTTVDPLPSPVVVAL